MTHEHVVRATPNGNRVQMLRDKKCPVCARIARESLRHRHEVEREIAHNYEKGTQ